MPADFQEVTRRIQEVGNLPTLPTTATEVMAMARDEDCSMTAVAAKIEGDPALSTRVLKVANSALFGLPQEITTIERAILVMGLRQVQNLLLSVSVIAAFPKKKGSTINREKFWAFCSRTGLICRLLNQKFRLGFDGEEFTAGVLHDVGIIVMDQYFHKEYIQVLDKTAENGGNLEAAEKEVLGFSHSVMGSWMLDHWKLPESFSRVAAFHHHPGEADEYAPLAALVSLGRTLSGDLGSGLPEAIPVDEGGLDLSEGWQILHDLLPELKKRSVAEWIQDSPEWWKENSDQVLSPL